MKRKKTRRSSSNCKKTKAKANAKAKAKGKANAKAKANANAKAKAKAKANASIFEKHPLFTKDMIQYLCKYLSLRDFSRLCNTCKLMKEIVGKVPLNNIVNNMFNNTDNVNTYAISDWYQWLCDNQEKINESKKYTIYTIPANLKYILQTLQWLSFPSAKWEKMLDLDMEDPRLRCMAMQVDKQNIFQNLLKETCLVKRQQISGLKTLLELSNVVAPVLDKKYLELYKLFQGMYPHITTHKGAYINALHRNLGPSYVHITFDANNDTILISDDGSILPFGNVDKNIIVNYLDNVKREFIEGNQRTMGK